MMGTETSQVKAFTLVNFFLIKNILVSGADKNKKYPKAEKI